MKGYQAGLVVVTFLAFVLLWSLPITTLPFGDVDASGHFALGDSQAMSNNVMKGSLPLYLNYSYGFANDGRPWYPPQFHLSAAVFERFSTERVTSAFLFYLFGSVLILLTTFFLVNKLFGFWPGMATMILLGVSVRDYTTYVWGLWPEKLSFAFVPLVLYCAYKAEKKYLVMLALLLGTQFLLHPQGAVHSVVILLFFTLFVWFKDRKFPYDWKYCLIAAVLFLVLVIPFAAGPLAFNENVMGGDYGDGFRIQELGSLFHWYPESIPYAPQMGDASFVYGIFWWVIVLFALLGFLYCLSKRKREHLLVISYVVAIYFLMHLNVIGITGRVHRSLNAESHIVYLLFVLGLFASYLIIVSLFESSKFKQGKLIKMFTAVSLMVLFWCVVGVGVHDEISFLQQAGDDVGRINQEEYDACEWIRENTAETAHVQNVGTLVYKKRKWVQALSMRPGIFDDKTFVGDLSTDVSPDMATHYFVDFSDAFAMGVFEQVRADISVFMAERLNITETNYKYPVYEGKEVLVYDR